MQVENQSLKLRQGMEEINSICQWKISSGQKYIKFQETHNFSNVAVSIENNIKFPLHLGMILPFWNTLFLAHFSIVLFCSFPRWKAGKFLIPNTVSSAFSIGIRRFSSRVGHTYVCLSLARIGAPSRNP